MKSLETFAEKKLTTLTNKGLKREIIVTERLDKAMIVRNGRPLISFCCNDYLNFSHHPKIKQAAIDAINQFGSGAGASRLITGDHPLIRTLEQRLAKIKNTDDACVFSSGYMANIGIIPTFIGKHDVIFLDELCHACLIAGSELSGGHKIFFRHNDMDHLQDLIHKERHHYNNALILTDGVFSMDGDLAPLDQLSVIAKNNDCWLMSDDAHGLGVIGDGKGSRHMFDPLPDIPLQMGTLSKAVGSFGGYLCASHAVIALIKTRARSLIYTTALPPASVAAALAALDIIETEHVYCKRPLENAKYFASLLDLPLPQSPIIPIIIGDTSQTMIYAKALENDGFLITGIRPPTVAEGTARLRFTFTALHRKEDIQALSKAIKKHGILP
ncbi:MAG: aminotransferase class I/II-fold pyridoxal phosphate-dependent enzyme [Emcibacter sp.]|nr:aminotransferase class I/II-fold pyridoxal phosphate-dependent enzyme [Emcibacter sp.]